VTTPAKYGLDWCEDVVLDGGTRVRLRPVRPEDKPKFVAGLARLSEESQYLRFFTSKAKFTDAELRYLTEVDGVNHFAIAAARVQDDGSEGDGVAIARFVRLADEPDVAEPAIVVIDEMQGHGLGRLLMERLIEAAVERGVKRFRSDFLAINRPMKELLAHLSPAAQFMPQGPIVVAEFPLVPEEGKLEPWRAWPIYEWFRLVAQRAVAMRRQFDGLFEAESVRAMIAKWRSQHGLRSSQDSEE
jgi:GNAT superfamily N-acetyltransferase